MEKGSLKRGKEKESKFVRIAGHRVIEKFREVIVRRYFDRVEAFISECIKVAWKAIGGGGRQWNIYKFD